MRIFGSIIVSLGVFLRKFCSICREDDENGGVEEEAESSRTSLSSAANSESLKLEGACPRNSFIRQHLKAPSDENEAISKYPQENQEASPSSPSSSLPINRSKELGFHVFLSFRGADTLKNFTEHLFDRLQLCGVTTFVENEKFHSGKKIEKLFEHMERSKVCIAILSMGYADSIWCLREIVKMVEIRKRIIPVFFYIEPSDVRNQQGRFASAFKEHAANEQLKQEEVRKWRDALKTVSDISGYSLHETAGHESKLIQMIVKDIMNSESTSLFDVAAHPVGLEFRVRDIKRVLDFNLSVALVVGIHGMGGIGKTTLAKAVYNEISRNFEACSFLSNVRETSKQLKGLESLQKQLLNDILGENDMYITDSHRGVQMIKGKVGCKKVLIVLDDVDDREQLIALAGSKNWFKKGSRIIITTRDKDVLFAHGVQDDKIYVLELLNDDQSMDLFSYHAFRRNQLPEDYTKLSKEVVSTTKGLPLALEVLGSLFFDLKTPEEWKILLKNMKGNQHKELFEVLKISYDALDYVGKQIFLDIACFFIGWKTENPIHMWEACGFHPRITIKLLLHKSLIKINTKRCFDDINCRWKENEVFEMHDQIRDMGRTIILQEKNSFPGRQSRQWGEPEELRALEIPTSAEGIMFTGENSVCLWEMPNQLRFLYFEHVHLEGRFQQFPIKMKWLSLRWCHQFNQLQFDFNLGGIVIVDLCGSSILAHAFVEQSLYKRNALDKLKVLNLSFTDITIMPNFTNFVCSCLEKLILQHCIQLTAVHESIGELKKLILLDLKACHQVCSLPNRLGGMASLEALMLDETSIQTIPESIEELTNLRKLSLQYCQQLKVLPIHSIRKLCSLKSLRIYGTHITGLKNQLEIDDLMDVGWLSLSSFEFLYALPHGPFYKTLTHLELVDAKVEALPDSIGELENLERLSLECKNLKALPDSICCLHSLKRLYLSDCNCLSSLPHLPCSLSWLVAFDCTNLEIMSNISNLTSLFELNLGACSSLKDVPGLERIAHNLELLTLPGPEGTLRCSSLTDDFKKRVLQESRFESLNFFSLKGGWMDVGSGVGHQHRLSFVLPNRIPVLSGFYFESKVEGELKKNEEESYSAIHVAVVSDDGLTVLNTTKETVFCSFLSRQLIKFSEEEEVIKCLNEGYRIIIVKLDLPQEFTSCRIALDFKFHI